MVRSETIWSTSQHICHQVFFSHISVHAFLLTENYRLQETYENHLIIKLVSVSKAIITSNALNRSSNKFDIHLLLKLNIRLNFLERLQCGSLSLGTFSFFILFIVNLQFQFFNAFLALFYIAFYIRDMDRLKTVST